MAGRTPGTAPGGKLKPTANCRSCAAPIRWGQTEGGNRIPLDPEPAEDGNVVVLRMVGGTPQIKVYGYRGDIPASVPFRYRSHFVTCPQGKEWRKK